MGGIIRAVIGQHRLSEHCYEDMINVTTIACTLTINSGDVYTKLIFGKDINILDETKLQTGYLNRISPLTLYRLKNP